MKNLYLIGLTGTLGSGKSTVRQILQDLGASGIDADKLAHVAMRPGTSAWNAIVEEFGTGVIHPNGKIDRGQLGARVFGDPQALKRLEEILHPAVGELIRECLRQSKSPVVVLEAIKLVEAKLHLWCDALWVVTASHAVQIERVMRDRHMSLEDAQARLAAQGDFNDKLALANVIIDNSHDLDTTRDQVQRAWKDTIRLDKARDKSEWLVGRIGETAALPSTAPKESTLQRSTPEMPVKNDQVSPLAPPFISTETAANTPPVPWETLSPSAPDKTSAATSSIPQSRSQSVPQADNSLAIEVRRARRSDLATLGVALEKMERRSTPIPGPELLARLGERGYRIAIAQDKVIALAAWHVENLVAVTSEVWVQSRDLTSRALSPLVSLIEQDARELQCEVSIILLRVNTPEEIILSVRNSGYQLRDLRNVHKIWQQVVEERMRPGDIMWVKQLRETMVIRPI